MINNWKLSYILGAQLELRWTPEDIALEIKA